MNNGKKTGIFKKITAALSGAVILINTMTGAVYAEASAPEDGAAMGRYLETEVELPDNDGTLEIRDIVRLTDGRLRLFGSSEETGAAMWDSSDGGAAWELAAALPSEYADLYFTDVKLCADGGGAGIVMYHGATWDAGNDTDAGEGQSSESADAEQTSEDAAAGQEEYSFHFVSFDAEGNAKHTPCTVSDMAKLQFSRSGELLWMEPGGDTYVVDRETGEAVLSLGSDANMIGICQNEALLLLDSELQRYDLSSGEPIARDEVLEEMLYANQETYEQNTTGGYRIMFTEDEEGRLYYCTSKGIFTHVMDGSVVEQIVDGELNSLSGGTEHIVALEIVNQSFYVIYTDADGRRKLLKYEYDPDIATAPEKELTIYSLREDAGIRQMVVLFQKEHPDTSINYQVGMSGTDGVTSADALRTLNTEILAGNGPDILIMDGMTVETYSEKGVLEDLSGILAEVRDSDGLLENIAYAYQKDETVPAVPVRFGIPMAVGNTQVLEKLEDLGSLGEMWTEELLGMSNNVALPRVLYDSCAAGWKKEDGTLDQEKLAQYIHVMKQIYDSFKESLTAEEAEMVNNYRAYVKASQETEGWDISSLGFYFTELLFPDLRSVTSQLCVGTLTDIDDYSGVSSVRRKLEGCEMKTYGGQCSDAFYPICTVGILKTAKEPDRAKDFVMYLLSEDGEIKNTGDGFPVNLQAFESVLYDAKWGIEDGISLGYGSADGTEKYNLTYSWPTQEELEWLENTAKQLTVCADTQSVQKEVVMKELNRCLDGEISEDEAENSIIQSINLYLAE